MKTTQIRLSAKPAYLTDGGVQVALFSKEEVNETVTISSLEESEAAAESLASRVVFPTQVWVASVGKKPRGFDEVARRVSKRYRDPNEIGSSAISILPNPQSLAKRLSRGETR